ncbi:hypothetical protein pipiens_005749 [Culex pipiens pipiens]|uniref:Lipase domain-containing protein n=1 Tax=Culex pipiens pipiens TaxID=38569 RepID=A0ABD1DUG3_CULPP
MWQLVTLALFAASIFAGTAAQLKLDMSDKSEAELLALMDDMTKLLNVQKAKLPGPIDQEVRFFCSNRPGAAFSQVMLNDQGLLAKMSMQKPVAFVIHGWTSSSQEAHFRDLAGNYSRYVDSNVCLVDWANLAAYSYDVASGQSIRMTANYLTRFVRFLNLNGIGYAKVTLIGHSLGAHISGFVGKNLGGEVGQIFALDPAGVMFTMPEDVGESNRLTKSDAKFVQVVYTTQGTLAMGISAGHQNLWMNSNGMYPQPGCKKVGEGKGLFSKTVAELTCSHTMSVAMFLAALDPKVEFTMKRCSSYWLYNIGMCALATKDKLGIWSKRVSGDFYGSNEMEFPYASKK